MSDKLLPCPFCGGEAGVCEETRYSDNISMTGEMVWCKSCNCSTDLYTEQHLAIAAWSRRTPDIVRCKDCQHYDHGCCVVKRYMGDDHIISMKPDDFCSYGKLAKE